MSALTQALRSCPARWVWAGYALACAAVEFVLAGADAGLWGTPLLRPLSYQYGGFWAGLLHGWEANYSAQPAMMFATYPFLHAGWQHLLGNVVTLGWLGEQIGRSYGAARLAALIGISAMGGGLGFALLTHSPRPMIGASGVIMGLFAAWIAADARAMTDRGAPFVAIMRMAAERCAVIMLLNLVAIWLEAGGLAWETHLGGFLAAALALALVPGLRPVPIHKPD